MLATSKLIEIEKQLIDNPIEKCPQKPTCKYHVKIRFEYIKSLAKKQTGVY